MIGLFNYLLAFAIIFVGLFGIISNSNLLKKLISLSVFQSGIILVFICTGYQYGGSIPMLSEVTEKFVNPLPQVLMLTAIVVGLASLAVGLALIISIKKTHGDIDERQLKAKN